MDARQRRIAKIAQALIDEHVVDGNESSDDFESISVSNAGSDQTNSEILEDESEGELQEPTDAIQMPQKKQTKTDEQKQSSRDLLRQQLSKTTIREQFKMTDEQFTQHLAVNAVWNRISRERAAVKLSVESEALQQQQTSEQTTKFSEGRPFTAHIQAVSCMYALQATLEISFGQQFTKQIIAILKQKVTPDAFQLMPESKQAPEDFDYKRVYEAFLRAEKNLQTTQRVMKVCCEQGRVSKYEILDRATEQPSIQLQSVQHQQQALATAQRAMAAQSNTIYGRSFPIQPFRDQTNYRTAPNSVGTQTDITHTEPRGYTTYKIVSEPPKRSYFSKFYVLDNGKPVMGSMQAQLQTDAVEPESDGANATVVIDGKSYDLKNEFVLIKQLVAGAQSIQIQRQKGRVGKAVNDLMKIIQKERSDLVQNGDLFVVNRNRQQQPPPITEKDGSWPTINAVYDMKPGTYEVAEVTQGEFQVQKNMIYQVTNGQDMPCLLDRWFSNDEFDAEKRKLYLQQPVSKYIHPVTGEGYNTVQDYKMINGRLKKQAEKESASKVNQIDENVVKYKQYMAEMKFEEANRELQSAFATVKPYFIQSMHQEKDDQTLDIAQKILGSCRYKQLD